MVRAQLLANLKGHQLCVILWKLNRGRNEVQVVENRLTVDQLEGARLEDEQISHARTTIWNYFVGGF